MLGGKLRRKAQGLVGYYDQGKTSQQTNMEGGFNILRHRMDHRKQLSAVSIKTRPLLPLSFPPLLPPPFHIVCVH